MLKKILSLSTAAIAALTAACEEGPATVQGTWRSPAATSTMVWAAAKGPILVEIHGNPFALPDPEFRSLVAQSMSGKVIGRVIHFTASRDEAPHPAARVVMAFDPPESLDARDLCEGKAVPTAAQPGEQVRVVAAFCHDDKLLASVRGWATRADGPTGRKFQRLLAQITRDLFPEAS